MSELVVRGLELEPSIMAWETTHLWWHSCLGSDTSGQPRLLHLLPGCCWQGYLWLCEKTCTICSRQTERRKTLGQRAASDVWGGNKFESDSDFMSGRCSTCLEDEKMQLQRNQDVLRGVIFVLKVLEGNIVVPYLMYCMEGPFEPRETPNIHFCPTHTRFSLKNTFNICAGRCLLFPVGISDPLKRGQRE